MGRVTNPTEPAHSEAAHLAEYEFIREGMRQDQRERQGFLGFALAASGLVLGLLMRSDPPQSSTVACFLVGLAAGVTFVAEILTVRASQGVASAGAYLRLFIEPNVEGLGFQDRNQTFLRKMHGLTSASLGFGVAFCALTITFACAWFAAPVEGAREWWQTSIVAGLVVLTLIPAGWLIRAGRARWTNVDSAWQEILDSERQRRIDAAAAEPERD